MDPRSRRLARTAKHKSPVKLNALHIIGAFWVLVALGIIGGYFLAPNKPPAPAPSSIQYARRPADTVKFEGGFDDDGARLGPSARVALLQSRLTATRPRKASKSGYHIYGTVTEAKTGRPVRRAYVTFRRQWTDREKEQWQSLRDAGAAKKLEKLTESLDATGNTQTDARGRYVLDPPRDGLYSIHAGARRRLYPAPKQITLTTARKTAQVDFALSLGASVAGRVTAIGSQQGAAGVRVCANGRLSIQDTSTQNDGTYSITGLVPGTYTITLDLSRCPYQVSGKVPSREVTITAADQEVKDINFVVDEAGVIWGYVLDPDKKPIKGADVLLCSSDSVVTQAVQSLVKQTPPLHDAADAEGYYELIGVPLNTEWRVYTQATNFAPQLSDPVLLTERHRQAHVDLFVLRGSSIHGRVVSSADGSPIARADVRCIPGYMSLLSPLNAPLAFKNTLSREDGSFDIPALPIGEYQILAMHDKFKFAATGEPIYPDAMHDISNVVVTLTPTTSGQYTVYGVVTDTRGAAIQGAVLHLLSAGGPNMSADTQTTTSDAQGRYQFTGVDAGFFMLEVEANGYTPKTVDKVRLDDETDVVLNAAASIEGRVLVRETNSPPPAYQVRAVPVGASDSGLLDFLAGANPAAGSRTFSNPDGAFQLTVAAGSYTLQAFAAGLTSGSQLIQVSQGERQTGVTLYVSQSGGTIQGRVTLTDGKNPAGATVSIGGEGAAGNVTAMMAETMQHNVQVGDDGQFTFRHLAPGPYVLAAQLTGYAQGRSNPVALGENQTVSGVEITLGHGGELLGYVTLEGQLKPGVIVTVVGNGVSQMATTDHNGQYRIEGLPEGTYLASAVSLDGAGLASQFSALHAQVQIADGAQTTYNFGSETGATINGNCAPPPSAGTIGIALLRVPGAPSSISALSLGNPASWFSGESDAGNYILGMARISSDGFFTIPNAPQGSFVLDVYYLSIGQLLSGGGRPAYSSAITVSGVSDMTVNIAVKTR